jgi:hypothetical protein
MATSWLGLAMTRQSLLRMQQGFINILTHLLVKHVKMFICFRGMAIFKLKTSYLPFVSCVWVSPMSIIAAGHDCTPLVFQINASGQVLETTKLKVFVTVLHLFLCIFSSASRQSSRMTKSLSQAPSLVPKQCFKQGTRLECQKWQTQS